ncbi:tRNA (adenosine(37)-N6)-dimethylallyltransferase MiaA [Rhodonellum sp.]|uniref:tRNA (adenosine(37)-N6)-dimethylallyltransferase MiaA n=1 Tax=Rhodonellum sp. TaxID=2231180 RepID=UPI00271D0B2E|nr:tRNA (adenosine(37)-N6)-dimethylallyltransferase MiaA [Rhodonellum sp.]MDO9550896.1 tRNA (adenosine(37)-N6)-dimethylallyltransferase MiaA [Rhodonellum sp.]
MKKNKHLLVIVGPTAVGKTELCLNLAKNFKTEIISSDSRQFFREMELGTAKPSAEELKMARHHFINTLSIHEEYDVKKFERDTLFLLETLFESHDLVVMTGGSGLYVDAICKGFDDIDAVDPNIRRELIQSFESEGIEPLQRELLNCDPEYYRTVDLQNPQRLMRALEVFRGTGKPFSAFREKKIQPRPFGIIKIGLERDREDLYVRINLRMDQMIEKGLFDEAEGLYPFRHLNALQTVGYSEIFGFIEGKYDKEEAVRLLKRNSRRYAKRQFTWFKKDEQIHWFHPDQYLEIQNLIRNHIAL